MSHLKKIVIPSSFTVALARNFDCKFKVYCSSFSPFGLSIEGLRLEKSISCCWLIMIYFA